VVVTNHLVRAHEPISPVHRSEIAPTRATSSKRARCCARSTD